jgi:hypothetical protein
MAAGNPSASSFDKEKSQSVAGLAAEGNGI